MPVTGQDNILARMYCRTCLTVVATLFHWSFCERPDCTYAVAVFRKNKIILRRRDGLFGLYIDPLLTSHSCFVFFTFVFVCLRVFVLVFSERG